LRALGRRRPPMEAPRFSFAIAPRVKTHHLARIAPPLSATRVVQHHKTSAAARRKRQPIRAVVRCSWRGSRCPRD
jgi:hypothetical protein